MAYGAAATISEAENRPEATVAVAAHGDWTRRAAHCGWALVAIGMGLRLIRYAANRSLWLDESYLAESILTYSFRQLVSRELMHWQAAPVGFLLLEKLVVAALGGSEYALRLVPLLSGLASVALFHAVVRHWLPAAGGLAALALFVLVEPLVYYSAEVKQYGTDVAVGLLILWLAQRFLDRPDSLRRLATIGVAGAVALFLSHPAVFVLAAAGLTMFGSLVRRRLHRPALGLALVGCAWVALIAIHYLVFLRPLTQHAGLVSYWSAGYMPWDLRAVPWLGNSLYDVFRDYSTMWMPLPDVAVLSTAFGIAWLWHRGRALLALLLLPIFLALVAAAAHRFPFSGRLILFVVPLVILLIGAGVQATFDHLRPGGQMVPTVFLLLLLGPSVGRAVFFAARPPGREEIKPILAHLRDHRQPSDVLYVFNVSQEPFRYYRDRFGAGPDRFALTGMEWIAGRPTKPTEHDVAQELSGLRGRGRVWVLVTHMRALGGPDEVPIMQAVLDQWGTRLDDHSARGARLMLYDLRAAREPQAR